MRDNPTLTKEQIDRIREVATLRHVTSGDVLYEPLQLNVPLFVVLESMAHLEKVEWQNTATGETAVDAIRHVFVMAGASPRTEWLDGSLALDGKGFILTGADLDCQSDSGCWPLTRPPMLLETSVPGVFAVGDSRAYSVKRVASAVGEGSMAVHLVHRFLAGV